MSFGLDLSLAQACGRSYDMFHVLVRYVYYCMTVHGHEHCTCIQPSHAQRVEVCAYYNQEDVFILCLRGGVSVVPSQVPVYPRSFLFFEVQINDAIAASLSDAQSCFGLTFSDTEYIMAHISLVSRGYKRQRATEFGRSNHIASHLIFAIDTKLLDICLVL